MMPVFKGEPQIYALIIGQPNLFSLSLYRDKFPSNTIHFTGCISMWPILYALKLGQFKIMLYIYV